MKTTIYTNCNVITMNEESPSADAFAVQEGIFTAVGDAASVRAAAGGEIEEIDLGGATVTPGFIETHDHLSWFGLTMFMADCSSVANNTMDEVLEKIAKTAQGSEPGSWVMGQGFDDTMNQEARHLTRDDLDAICPDQVVMIMHTSAHLAYTNTKGLELAGITADTPQPHDGHIDKDASGRPTGVLRESGAMLLLMAHMPPPPPDIYYNVIPPALANFNQYGVTSAHDGGIGMAGHGKITIDAYRKLYAEGRLTVRVYMTIVEEFYRGLADAGLGMGFGDEWLKMGSVKSWQDGSIQGLTAALAKPYHNSPDWLGEMLIDQDELNEMVAKYQSMGMQVALHANGDRAIESVLMALEHAQELHPHDDLRHMIIHAQTATEDQVARMAKLGAIPSYFIMHVHYWGDRHAKLFLGPERAARLNPLGSSQKAGMVYTVHADTPVTPAHPLMGIHCAVNRLTSGGQVLGAEQRISVLEALKTYTTYAAYCSFEENIKGQIAEGMLADFVCLDQDLLSIDPLKILDTKVLATYVGGKKVYEV